MDKQDFNRKEKDAPFNRATPTKIVDTKILPSGEVVNKWQDGLWRNDNGTIVTVAEKEQK